MSDIKKLYTIENLFIALPLIVSLIRFRWVHHREQFWKIKFYLSLSGTIVMAALSVELIKYSLVGFYLISEHLLNKEVNPNTVIHITASIVYTIVSYYIIKRWINLPKNESKREAAYAAYNLLVPILVACCVLIITIMIYLVGMIIYIYLS